MPSAKKTPNYGLSQWEPNEYLKREDLVNDFATIDAALKENADAAASAAIIAEEAKQTADAAIPKSMATEADQVLVSTGAKTWAVKTLAQFKSWLALKVENISDFAASVRSTALTGLSTATSAVITATDTVLSALGKLQAQITEHADREDNPHNVTAAQVGAHSKEETASTETKMLFGLGADAVPDDVFAAIPPMLNPKAYDLLISQTLSADTTQIDISLPSISSYSAIVVEARLLPATDLRNSIRFTFNGISTNSYAGIPMTGGTTSLYSASLGLGDMYNIANGYMNLKIEIALDGNTVSGQYFYKCRYGDAVGDATGMGVLFEVNKSSLAPSALSTINLIGTRESGIKSGSKIYVYGVKK